MKRAHSALRTAFAAGLAAGIAGGLLAPSALAQHALGDGKSLDRNLKQGSGPQNTRVRDIEATIRYQNSIVTGNAPDGRSFRGDAGYLAADEFRASLGSNDLFNYRRDSVGSLMPSAGLRGTEALQYQSALATGQVPASDLGGSLTVARAGSGASGTKLFGSGAGSIRSTSDFLASRSISPALIDLRQRSDGSGWAVAASPLLGVRKIDLQAAGQAPLLPSAAGAPGAEPIEKPTWAFTGYEARPRGVGRPVLNPTSNSMDTSAPTARPESEQTRINDAVLTRFQAELAKGSPADAAKAKSGEESGAAPAKPGEVDPNKPADPADWRAKLDELRLQLNGQKPKAKTAKPKDTPESTPPSDPNDRKPGGGGVLPTAEEAAAERQTKMDAQREDMKRRFREGARDEATVKALKASKTKVNDLALPASGAKNLAYSEHMAIGQNLLADGRYFDSEERFARALTAIPGDPMAQVGRIHSQIASGLYVSAAINLRNVLKDHPEYVATVYDARVLPKQERWATIAGQLRQRLEGEDVGARGSAGLLLAYMGRQFGDLKAVNDGLETMAKHIAEDPTSEDATLLKLLKAVWIEGEPAPGAPK